MTTNEKFQNGLLGLIEHELCSQSDVELKQFYGVDRIQDSADYKSTKPLIQNIVDRYSRKVAVPSDLRKVSSFSNGISAKKDLLIAAIVSGRIPAGLTLAFREGEDIPDADVEGILEDLRDLDIDLSENDE
ncbi:MAG: hypothetical protein Q7V56_02890 [Gammaproteobacteria bacterium]|nr:hypothetical protein [Gammaproteobacteria bacterium]